MLRGFNPHRRYSITHRAVQRLRELAPSLEQADDEAIRDRLDAALCQAEDEGRAVKTLDAMLGEPQVLVAVEGFDEVMYAIIKEDTVVTVLPKGHGEEILQRGLALEQRVRAGEVRVPDREERWEIRRRWRRDPPMPMVIEERGPTRTAPVAPQPISEIHEPTEVDRPDDPIAATLHDALNRAERRAFVAALRESLRARERDDELIGLWNELAATRAPQTLTIGDLLDACARL
jgi:hypothetical protein